MRALVCDELLTGNALENWHCRFVQPAHAMQNNAAASESGPERPELIPTRASLLSRLKGSSADEGWREFFDTYWKLIYYTARRAGLADSEAQDIVQETMLGLSHHLPQFKYD